MESGRVYRWRPDFDDKPQCFSAPNAVGQSRLGQTIRVARRGDKELLVVTAPHDSQFSRLSGSVMLLQDSNHDSRRLEPF
ncbi:hypothetical protein H4S07_004118 [Coemansia furcata]|uniref:Uncharacterized protein n=1 Tax=Coemansia furcata TaxID=417177 RepID=A0ACC1LC62_9FUNG|nr:hypothetical protein H4S07_004118 [Coemansia furcata]